MRRHILLAFEQAERETNPLRKQALLTFVVIGGGPTGVELAGCVIEGLVTVAALPDIPAENCSVEVGRAHNIGGRNLHVTDLAVRLCWHSALLFL